MKFLFSAFSWDNVTESLNILWKGVLAIAIVIAVIFFVVWLMNYLGNKIPQWRAERAARRAAETATALDDDPAAPTDDPSARS